MNRRSFLGALGVFSILPGAGRVWRAVRPPVYPIVMVPDETSVALFHGGGEIDMFCDREEAEKFMRAFQEYMGRPVRVYENFSA